MNTPETPSVCFSENVEISLRSLARMRELQAFARENRRRFATLSPREREVLGLICTGLNNEEIAARLFRSVNTIRTHRNNIWRQLEIRSVVEAVRWGQAFDLV